MNKIKVNNIEVQVSAKTYKRILKTASEKKISFDQAVSLLLEKVN